MVQGKGLNCKYLISKKPISTASMAEKSIPVSIFNTDMQIRKKFLRKWLKDNTMEDEDCDLRKVLDWDYYIERLTSTILKIIIIPAALQGIKGILPEVKYPEWLDKMIKQQDDKLQQKKMEFYFQKKEPVPKPLTQPSILPAHGHPEASEQAHQQAQKQHPQQGSSSKKKSLGQFVRRKNQFSLQSDFKNWLREQKSIWIENHRNFGKGQLLGSNNLLKKMFHSLDE